MQQSSLNNEILNLEKKFWTAMCEDDIDSLMTLTDFPCVVAGAQGAHAFDEDEFKKMFEQGKGRTKNFEFDENSIEIRQVSPEAAVIAYQVKAETDKGMIEAVDASTWIKRDGKWACAMHTETELN